MSRGRRGKFCGRKGKVIQKIQKNAAALRLEGRSEEIGRVGKESCAARPHKAEGDRSAEKKTRTTGEGDPLLEDHGE